MIAPSMKDVRRKHMLTDTIHDTLMDRNFAVVPAELNKIAKEINTDYGSRHEARTVSELKEFVGKLGGLKNK